MADSPASRAARATLHVTHGVVPYPPHFVDGRFTNLEPTPDRTRAELLRWQLGRLRPGQHGPWRDWTPVRERVPAARVARGPVVTWINHATVLVQLDGVNLLVDPIWSERASPVPFAGPKRRHAPGVAFDALPPLDAVLVTHDHYDHLDLPTLRRLVAREAPPILTGLGNASYLRANGVPGAQELDWGDAATLLPAGDAARVVRLTFLPARHWSARGTGDHRRTLWGAFVVEGPSGRVYLAGDTGYGAHLADAGTRFGPFDAAVLPIGAYRPEWFMHTAHMSPADAVRAARDLRAVVSIPVHHYTFDLADEGQDEPVDALRAALARAGAEAPSFRVLAPGEAWASDGGPTG